MLFLPKLKELKDKRVLTNQDISELSRVPLSTVNRILSGQTDNPYFENVADIVIALNGSLDELVGIRSPDDTPVPTMTERAIAGYQLLLDEKDKRIHTLGDAVRNLRKEKTRILIFMGIFFSLIVFVLLFDLLNGHFGYIRF